MKKAFFDYGWLVAVLMLISAAVIASQGCTSEQLQGFGDDAVAALDVATEKAEENPTPVGLILAGIAGLSTLASKTVRRKLKGAASTTKSKAADTLIAVSKSVRDFIKNNETSPPDSGTPSASP